MPAESPPAQKTLERLPDGRRRFHGCSRITDYKYLGKLGEGTFGVVSKARSNRTGELVATKKILVHDEKDGFPITALREIRLLKQLDHINVLKLEEMAIERPKKPNDKPSMYMITPYMEHDLSGLLENPDVTFSEAQIKCYMKQLLEGCAYLHGNKILHRDMKAANLLINNRGILQIADFGLARPYDDEPPRPGRGGGEATRDYTTLVVTRWYRAPELLLHLRKYTTAIDMWGVGCVFGEMFKHKPILMGNTDLNQAELIFNLLGSPTDTNMPGWRDLPGCDGINEWEPKESSLHHQFRDLSQLALSLLGDLLRLDWRKRINAIDALRHPYFHTEPYPARPEDLPVFEDSHELDRKKFRDQKSKPPPAPAGGTVGIGSQGEWGINDRPPPYDGRGPAYRMPGGQNQSNGHANQGYGRRYPGPSQNGHGDYNTHDRRDISQPESGPHYSYSHHGPSHASHGDHRHAPGGHPLPPRPPNTDLPPRPPPPDENLRYSQSAHRHPDDGRNLPPRSRIPAGAVGGSGHAYPPDRDTYIPPYSNADSDARSGQQNPRDRDRDRQAMRFEHRKVPDRRSRSRSPRRDRGYDRDLHGDWKDRDRNWDRARDHRERERDRQYGMPESRRW